MKSESLFIFMKENSHKGKFIVFEGLDGSGKSVQAQLLKDYLEATKNVAVVLTKEPTDEPPVGTWIHQILKKEIQVSPTAFQLLFCADRSEHLEKVIKPALEENKYVISDRYFYSTIAYGSLDLDINWLMEINKPFLIPDIVFLLKVRPQICIERIDQNRINREFFEKIEKLRGKVWQTYEILSQKFSNIRIIDGEKNIEGVFEEIKSKIDL